MSGSVSVNDASFKQEVLDSQGLVLVDFWAEWCGPCRMLAPILEEVSGSMKGKLKVVKMNVDENPSTPTLYGVRSIPTLVLFKNGKALSTKTGLLQKNKLEEWVTESL
ncbi:thioredoxin-1 [Caedimonas varicaedens]|jgi:thioredoxin 1|uniref:Thioredoxin n=1 Tax=Caedimonas varicaedens TaxID=1629334 RepID=A0A0K8MEF7_9PROT|nr:thioredoxin-1 [Caedimonas varicaedens]